MGVWGAHMVISWFIMSLTYFLAEHCYSTDLTARWQQLRRIYASATVKLLVLAIRPENINKNRVRKVKLYTAKIIALTYSLLSW